jgi:predicted MPP superfamily phosphohydrolase
MLSQSVHTLLAAGLWPGVLCAAGQSGSGEFHFVVVNDLHYLNEGCRPWLEVVIKQMKRHPERIEFCLLAGDLTEHGKPEQMAPVRDLLKGLGKPTYAVIGNHDHLAPDDRRAYEECFPERRNYRFEHNGWQFLGLDTTAGRSAYGTKVHADTLHWLDETLPKLDKKTPTVVFTHFPLGPHVITRPENAAELLARFKEYNLQAVFSGHYHAFTERQVRKTTLTTNRCCSFTRQNHDGSKEKGYFLCHAKDGIVQRAFVEVQPEVSAPGKKEDAARGVSAP